MIRTKVLSSLEKVFAGSQPEAEEIKEFSFLKNEKFNFQIAFVSDTNDDIKISFENEEPFVINAFEVRDVPVGLATFPWGDDYVISREPGMYPDLLIPAENIVPVKANEWHSIWFEIKSKGDFCGTKDIIFSIGEEKVSVKFFVVNAVLPEQKLIYTNWYHSDCLCDYYGIEQMSDEYWKINRNFIETAAKHGMNCILTPLFTPPLDTAVGGERTTVQLVKVRLSGSKYLFDFRNLKKWVDMCRECGIRYFEMSHPFTQWGAKHSPKIIAYDRKGREKKIFGWETRTSDRKYEEFIRQFGKALNKFIERENLGKNVFFHISDEPDKKQLKTYRKRAAIIKEVFGRYPIIDALSDYDFYKSGSVTIPVPSEGVIDNFAGKVDSLWTYYCCSQCNNNLPNRFIAMPSLRNRIIGVLAYVYKLDGFLQWGYNFYNTQYSLKHISPYDVTDAGNAFPSGDAFMVYPGEKGEALCSLRLKVLYDAFQDLGALTLLESKIGRNKVLELIGNISFTDYPRDEKWLLDLRNNVNCLIQSNV